MTTRPSTLEARARRLMRQYAEEELALQVAYFERKDREIEEGKFDADAPGPDLDVRLTTLRNLLAILSFSEQVTHADR
jgi:hypothetical protein